MAVCSPVGSAPQPVSTGNRCSPKLCAPFLLRTCLDKILHTADGVSRTLRRGYATVCVLHIAYRLRHNLCVTGNTQVVHPSCVHPFCCRDRFGTPARYKPQRLCQHPETGHVETVAVRVDYSAYFEQNKKLLHYRVSRRCAGGQAVERHVWGAMCSDMGVADVFRACRCLQRLHAREQLDVLERYVNMPLLQLHVISKGPRHARRTFEASVT